MYVDDVLITGRKEEIEKFKKEFKKIYKITEMGQRKKHLGIKYEWIKTKTDIMIKMNMDVMIRNIVQDFETIQGGIVKTWKSPGYPEIKLEKAKENEKAFRESEYRSIVGK